VGPHPRRLDGALGASNSSASFRNCTEAFDTARPLQSHEQAGSKITSPVLDWVVVDSAARSDSRDF
jgi:hypothetical protein